MCLHQLITTLFAEDVLILCLQTPTKAIAPETRDECIHSRPRDGPSLCRSTTTILFPLARGPAFLLK